MICWFRDLEQLRKQWPLEKNKKPARSEGEQFWGPIELAIQIYEADDFSSTNF